MPVNYNPIFPVPFDNETELNEYYFVQAFPKEIVFSVGRIIPTNFVDRNRFAAGASTKIARLHGRRPESFGHPDLAGPVAAGLLPQAQDPAPAGVCRRGPTVPRR